MNSNVRIATINILVKVAEKLIHVLSSIKMARKEKNIKSSVFLHMIENQHNIYQNSLKMIFPESRKFHRKFKDALIIRSNDNNMNSSRGMNINPIWCSTLIIF